MEVSVKALVLCSFGATMLDHLSRLGAADAVLGVNAPISTVSDPSKVNIFKVLRIIH